MVVMLLKSSPTKLSFMTIGDETNEAIKAVHDNQKRTLYEQDSKEFYLSNIPNVYNLPPPIYLPLKSTPTNHGTQFLRVETNHNMNALFYSNNLILTKLFIHIKSQLQCLR